ncbi:DUF3560 domain-containing protein [Burkholderia glumae]|uniref:DUF3560 domain-containing protein n=2 Tax=Burkholderia glumae TaxID=337 RepID=A0AAQ0BWU4_BURGL|nr:DUF3560 domain-containing protein [Burkholderia glumae]AJY62496.1 hypothetical protein KS03_5754 [Burkholderia glumae LMG 2196 = ATCC 33617]NVE26402.1 DUF3560 domain-containing protein [Burkholderia glumae]PNL04129.1 DUF3560 domain-containing protein [Burkholderia glumae]QJW82412.1 DUF3560 domain-containing protein [Burkholderia glumae]QKM51966.1 hypothetical protein B7760_06044 [Burkholderia glumae]
MQTLTATYSPEDNKLRLYAATRLDSETYQRIHAAGFRHAPKQSLFVAPMWTPPREDLLIELCGQIDDEDASLSERAKARAERYAAASDRAEAQAQARRAAVDAIAEHIPLGQPILVGHHSEGRHRRDLARMDASIRQALTLWDKSEYWQRRARAAIANAQYKERPDVRHRRIKRLEADLRARQRSKLDREALVASFSPAQLTREQALAIAYRVAPDLWRTLESRRDEYHAIVASYLETQTRAIAHNDRWINHLECRLIYERAMLGENGGIEKVRDYRAPSVDQAAAAKTASKLPPLCNYAGPDFHHMTQAQWKQIHRDYKGTRELGVGANRPAHFRPDVTLPAGAEQTGRHRVRTMIRHGALVAVYLTDAKRTEPPAQPAAE